MTSSEHARAIGALEAELVLEFQRHPAFGRMAAMSRGELLDLLLQRRFVSLAFTPMYELALDALADDPAAGVVRALIRAEFDDGGPSTHRERLVCDLEALGATRRQVLASRPSPHTLRVIEQLVALVAVDRPRDASRSTERDDRRDDDEADRSSVLAGLRFAGEVLVAVEYAAYWPHLERLGLCADDAPGKVRSVFYHPHLLHDAPTGGAADTPHGPPSHADQLAERLRALRASGSRDLLDAQIEATRRAERVKRGFYDPWRAS